jgi:Carboxypeptidase regulatory-like domain
MPRLAVLALFTIFVFAGLLPARVLSEVGGALRGTVKDSTGAVIPGATVTATDPGGRVSTADTGADGSYRINGLDNGTYTIP